MPTHAVRAELSWYERRFALEKRLGKDTRLRALYRWYFGASGFERSCLVIFFVACGLPVLVLDYFSDVLFGHSPIITFGFLAAYHVALGWYVPFGALLILPTLLFISWLVFCNSMSSYDIELENAKRRPR